MSAQTILAWSLVTGEVCLLVAMACAVLRMLCGPKAQDRVLAIDALYVDATLLLLVFGIHSATTIYFEAALVIALFGFAGTVALAKFLMRGEVVE